MNKIITDDKDNTVRVYAPGGTEITYRAPLQINFIVPSPHNIGYIELLEWLFNLEPWPDEDGLISQPWAMYGVTSFGFCREEDAIAFRLRF